MIIHNIILDWSGTLVDDLGPVLVTTNHVFATCGLAPISLQEFRAEFCLPIRKFYQRRLPKVPQAKLEEIFLTEYPRHHNGITILPHTLDFLEFCQQRGLGIYIASTVDPHTYETQAARFGIDRFVTKPYIGIEDKTAKIHQILDENRFDRNETMFVGDMEHDIEAGKAGGVHTCAVLTGYNDAAKLQAMAPDLVCDHLGELQQILSGQQVVRG